MCMASLIKATSADVPPGEAVFFRSFFAVPVIFVWLAMRGELRDGWKTKNPMGHVWRGIIGTLGMGFGFTALGLLPLPEVTAIGYAAPLLVVVFAAMFLDEKVGVFRLSTVALGMVGVLIVLSPRLSVGAQAGSVEALGAMVTLMAAFMAAMAQILVRKLVATEDTAAIVLWFSVTSTIGGLLTLPWGWTVPSNSVIAMLVLCGFLGGVGQIFLTSSYKFAEASLIAPFEYTSMILALFVGYFVFSEVPTGTMMFGAAIVIAAGVLIIWRERQLGMQRTRQRKVTGKTGV